MRSAAAAPVAIVCRAGFAVQFARQVAFNAGRIAMAFILSGLTLVWVESWRPLGPSGGRR